MERFMSTARLIVHEVVAKTRELYPRQSESKMPALLILLPLQCNSMDLQNIPRGERDHDRRRTPRAQYHQRFHLLIRDALLSPKFGGRKGIEEIRPV